MGQATIGITEPQRMTATLYVEDTDRQVLQSLAPELMSLRVALIRRMNGQGWIDVPLDDIHGRIYLFGGYAHLIAVHQPTNLDAILIGGSYDGTEITMDCASPPLTIGVLSGTHFVGDEHVCDSADGIGGNTGEWSCWQYAGLAQGSKSLRRWAYSPAAARGITSEEQGLHDRGEDHHDVHCARCKLHYWVKRTSRLLLPDEIRESEARKHLDGSPHATTGCSACRADFFIPRS